MNKNQLIGLGVFAILAFLILSFVPPPASVTNRAAMNEGVLLGVFEGTTPCADCPGIVQRLTLVQNEAYSAEGMFELSMTYLESDTQPFVTTGIWTTERGTPSDPDATVYVINPDMPDTAQRFLRVNETTIRMLDQTGNEIDSSPPFDLTLMGEDGPVSMPERRTLTGTQVCLPHKDPNGPQTKECAIGFKADDGTYYALDLGVLESMDNRTLLEKGSHVEIQGTFVPGMLLSTDHWQKYIMEGVISVTSVRAL